jgi:peptidoglycan hydrolase-like protein with peptidoglycan-binding domain
MSRRVLDARGALELQRTAGNRAVAGLLAGDMKASAGILDSDTELDQRSAGSAVPVQRRMGDGHDLASPRFAGDATLEGCFDNERVLKVGSKGKAVEKVQQLLVDLGFRLPRFGVDGDFGTETKAALQSFQADSGISGPELDGIVGPDTMTALDERGRTFAGAGGTVTAPAAAVGPPGAVTLGMPAHIRAPSTPGVMAEDRIPPRVDTDVQVNVAGLGPPLLPVTLSVAGSGGANGDVTIDGAPSLEIFGPVTVHLRGTTQTAPGNGGNLQLVATQGGVELGRSAGFSVSSVPQRYTDVFLSDLTGASRGFVVQDGWESDSGSFADLDGTEISEEVEVTQATGCFAGLGGNVSGYLPGDSLTQDTHSSATATLTSPGRRIAQQTSKFRDHRAGAADIPMRDAGYLIDRRVVRVGGVLRFVITKSGKATTANGTPSGQGEGFITRNQAI